MGWNDISGAFTARPQDNPDFESAGEASRRIREAAEALASSVKEPEFLSTGRFQEELPNISPSPLPAESPQVAIADETQEPAAGIEAQEPVGAFVRPSVSSPVYSASAPQWQASADGQEAKDPRDLRWAWAEIDLSAIRHNVYETRKVLTPGARLMAVVKADGYGHGAVEVAKAALGAGADYLAVATVPEGIELREAGISAPILILSQPPNSSVPYLVRYDLTPSVYDPGFVVAYGEAADQAGKRGRYHLAINSGMNRIGVHYDFVVQFLQQVSFHRALELEGTFTHFATADCHENLEFERQRRRFEHAVNNIRLAGFNPGIIHAANSAAIYRYPSVHYDMVRLGISLYGFHPCVETRDVVNLRPAMAIKARISDARAVPMSEGVSYGLQYRSPGSVKICTVPLGYADGLRVGLSGNTDFIMDGMPYRQVGKICMDQCMFEADLRRKAKPTREPQIGDEVIIVGQQGDTSVTLDAMAEKLGTIHYELAIGFGQRLSRLYVQG